MTELLHTMALKTRLVKGDSQTAGQKSPPCSFNSPGAGG